MTTRQALKEARHTLQDDHITDADSSARLLLAHILNYNYTQLMTHLDDELTEEQLHTYRTLITRRSHNEPTNYIIGQKAFFGLPFFVTNQTLIPRSETEQLVHLVLDYITDLPVDKKLTIVDVGTGSGIIALSLAHALQELKRSAEIIATDVSKDALTVARKNAKQLKIEEVSFVQSDLINSLNQNPDIMVANLPYIPSERIATLDPQVRDHEPHLALDGGLDGLGLIRQLFEQVVSKNFTPKVIFLEIDETHATSLSDLAQQFWPQAKTLITKDLAALPRFATILLN